MASPLLPTQHKVSVSRLLSPVVVVVAPSVEYQSWTEEREAVLTAEGIAPQQTGRTSVLRLCVLEPLLTRWLPLHFVLTVSSICLTLHLRPPGLFPFFTFFVSVNSSSTAGPSARYHNENYVFGFARLPKLFSL